MTTAYTSLLGLALPVTGELSGTWGDTVDNGITRYLDIAVAGTVTLTNDGAVTLSLTNGDSTATNIVSSLTGAGTVSAQFAIIRVTGTLTVAKVLTAPSSSRTYVVVNAATGSTVTVKASGQTGVSIAVGETAFVYFNGTDYAKISGTASVTSFSAGTTGFTPSTATTGAVTLAGTLATTNGGTGLTSFTANGVVYASSSSALATGSALTFDGTSFGVGTASPSRFIDFEKNQNAGTLTRIGNTTSGTGAYSALQLSSSTSSYLYNFSNAYTTSGIFAAGATVLDAGGSGGLSFNAASVGIIFNTGSSEQMRLTSTGLGIGTSSPAAKLQVVSTGAATIFGSSGASNVYSQWNYNASAVGYLGNGSAIVSAGAATDFALGATNKLWMVSGAGSQYAVLDSSGNLGLGVTPSAWNTITALQVKNGAFGGYSSTAYMGANWYYGSGDKYITSTGATIYTQDGNTSSHKWYTAPSGTAGNAITFTQAMTLDASGNLLLGTTSGGGAGGLTIYPLGGGAGTAAIQVFNKTNTATDNAILFRVNGSTVSGISYTSTAVTYGTVSDYRLKTVVGAINDSGIRIDALEPIEYTWNSNGQRTRGFLAHKFQEVYASSVTGAKNAVDEDGKPIYQGMQASTSEVIADLVAEIQSLRKRLAAAGI